MDEITRIGREVAAPKLINIVAGGLTPAIDHATLTALGFAIAIYPTTALLAATDAVIKALAGIDNGAESDAGLSTATMEDFFRLVGLDDWFDIGDRWCVPGE
jgi:2-methylisocitrate lyase-like PEP mutase family enzyme